LTIPDEEIYMAATYKVQNGHQLICQSISPSSFSLKNPEKYLPQLAADIDMATYQV